VPRLTDSDARATTDSDFFCVDLTIELVEPSLPAGQLEDIRLIQTHLSPIGGDIRLTQSPIGGDIRLIWPIRVIS
jgi:hypothetical protein